MREISQTQIIEVVQPTVPPQPVHFPQPGVLRTSQAKQMKNTRPRFKSLDVRASAWLKWHHVYYFLAAFDVLIVLLGHREKCIGAGMDDYISKPVKSEDLARILARIFAASHDEEENESRMPNESLPPVDMVRLHEAMGDEVHEILEVYLRQTSANLANLEGAIAKGNAMEVDSISHNCAGTSANCGMTALVNHCESWSAWAVKGPSMALLLWVWRSPVSLNGLRHSCWRILHSPNSWKGLGKMRTLDDQPALRVLIADDDPVMRQMLKAMITKEGLVDASPRPDRS